MDGISDHHSVNCNSKLRKEAQPTVFKTYGDYSCFDYDYFPANLVSIRWDSIYGIVNVSEAVEFFSANILGIFVLHAPLKTVRIEKWPAPWLTDNIRLMMKLRIEAYTKYRKFGTAEDWEEYKRFSNLIVVC
ncbi:hypothetical protein JTB14_028380 [Gonioctena quinquepunctata]|nr:hypothetical protein JTB14_028380 [Gonioctena quinquepunctata]